jgi:hypothetical protein
MDHWLSYAPGDFLMFGPQVYWRLFEMHNVATWPLPVLAPPLGAVVALTLATGRQRAPQCAFAAAALACLGTAHFLLARYAPINWIAGWAAWAFGLQALALIGLATFHRAGAAPARADTAAAVGWAFLAGAILFYPLSGVVLGRTLAQAEIAGLAPDPTALACLGLACVLLRGWPRVALSVIPLAWCAASAATLMTLGEAQGRGLAAAAILWGASRPWRDSAKPADL